MFAMKRQAASSRGRQSSPRLSGRRYSAAPPRSAVQRSSCACGGGCPRCRESYPPQSKLEVSQPGDALEQQADRIAEQVLRMPQPGHAGDPAAHEGSGVRVSRYSSDAPAHGLPELPHTARDVVRSPGEPLDPTTRAFMEPRFGRDLSQVRVHAGASAAASARSYAARAYTLGDDIVFGSGQFRPETVEGRRLLAHELTHVVQHERGSVPSSRVLRQPADSPPEMYAIQVMSTAKGMRKQDECVALSSYNVADGSKYEHEGACNLYRTPPCQAAVLVLPDFYHHVRPDPPAGTAAPFKLTLAVEREVDGSSETPLRKGGYDGAPKYGIPGTRLQTSLGHVVWMPLEGSGTLHTVASMEHPHGTLNCRHELPYDVTPCTKEGAKKKPSPGEEGPGESEPRKPSRDEPIS
jgi:hypothetical protein